MVNLYLEVVVLELFLRRQSKQIIINNKMDAYSIESLFNDQTKLKTYVKKDLVKIYDPTSAGNTLRFRGDTFTNKLIDFSDGFILFRGKITSDDPNTPLANNPVVG